MDGIRKRAGGQDEPNEISGAVCADGRLQARRRSPAQPPAGVTYSAATLGAAQLVRREGTCHHS
jgi:hypothetical protein